MRAANDKDSLSAQVIDNYTMDVREDLIQVVGPVINIIYPIPSRATNNATT
jgi:hypothetical protein